jgi:integrase
MPEKDGIDGKIAQANGRLKNANVGVKIERVGDRLYLRSTFPPKPGSDRERSYQQRISTGIHANGLGIKTAEAEARKIGALIDCGEFDWVPYLKEIEAPPLLVSDWVKKFEVDYFTRRDRNPKSETTWKTEYSDVFKKLPELPLNSELIKTAILRIKPDTRQRKRYCMTLAALAKLAGIEINIDGLSGSYSPSAVQPRDLPDDATIAEWFYKIPNKEYQWAYGMLATYGLRPHEIFRLNLDSMPILEVLENTKTGSRKVWACYPEWVKEFDLENPKIPKVNGKNNTVLGSRISVAFNRYDIPFNPYCLRHCWAVRTLEFGLSDSLAAQQMGHSVQVHNNQYHAWIDERHQQKAYNLIMERADRPKPPGIKNDN